MNPLLPVIVIRTYLEATGRGGGVAAIFHSDLLVKSKPKLSYGSFEILVLGISNPTWTNM